MKKLLFVIPTMRLGGAEKSLVTLLSKLNPKQFDITLLLFASEGELLESVPSYVKIDALPPDECAMVLEGRFYFKHLLRKCKIIKVFFRCLVAVFDRWQAKSKKKKILSWNIYKKTLSRYLGKFDVAISYLEGTTACYVIDKVDAKRKIGWIHTNFASQDRVFAKEFAYYKKFNRLATISGICLNGFVEKYPQLEDRISVIENITDKDSIFRLAEEGNPFAEKNDQLKLVTIGRLETVKGIDLAIEAARLLKQNGISFYWHICGDGAMFSRFSEMSHSYTLENEIHFNGAVKNPYPFLKNADIVVQPSRYEGKSIVLDEAKILGKPIVVTNYDSVKDQIVDDYTGMIVDLTPDSIADGIMSLYNDKEKMLRLSDNCVRQSDNSVQMINKFLNLLEE